jgi:hypothetical protein
MTPDAQILMLPIYLVGVAFIGTAILVTIAKRRQNLLADRRDDHVAEPDRPLVSSSRPRPHSRPAA